MLPEAETLAVVRERIETSQYSLTEQENGFGVTGPDGIQVRLRSV